MVRAGVVNHPAKWAHSGLSCDSPPTQTVRLDRFTSIGRLICFSDAADFQQAHRQWVEEAVRGELSGRDARWSEAIAVGTLAFGEKVKRELGSKAMHCGVEQVDGVYALRESSEAYRGEFAAKNEALRPQNTFPWQRFAETAET